jgi:hypothetical protein
VVACDYVHRFQPKRKEWIRGKIIALNQEVFHTGTGRMADTQKFDYAGEGAEVLARIEEALTKFNGELRQPYPTDWLPTKPATITVKSSQPTSSSSPTYLSVDRGTTTSSKTISFTIPTRKGNG